MHDAKILSERLNEALNELTHRKGLIIFRRRLNDEEATLEQLGSSLGVSKERVRQLEHRALKKLPGKFGSPNRYARWIYFRAL